MKRRWSNSSQALMLTISCVLVLILGRQLGSTGMEPGQGRQTVDLRQWEVFASPLAHPVCARIPNASATFLYNSYWAMERGDTSMPRPPTWLAASDLRRGVRTLPRSMDWARFMDKIDATLKTPSAPPIQVLVLSGDPITVSWTKVIQEGLNSLFGTEKSWVNITTMAIQGSKSKFATELVTSGERAKSLSQGIDVIVDAYATSEMKELMQMLGSQEQLLAGQGATDISQTPQAANYLRQQKQAWFRNVLLSDCKHVGTPLLLVLDDYIGSQQGSFLDSLYTRTVQRLTDWYQIPMLSLGALLRPKLYGGQIPWQKGVDESNVASAHLVAFGLLTWAIEFCATTRQQDPSPLLKPGVHNLVEQVLPPNLDVDLTLQEVSAKWKRAAEEQSNCTTRDINTTM